MTASLSWMNWALPSSEQVNRAKTYDQNRDWCRTMICFKILGTVPLLVCPTALERKRTDLWHSIEDAQNVMQFDQQSS